MTFEEGQEFPFHPIHWDFDYRKSSGYGWRTSPISGKKRFHNGVDYACARFTPLIAPFDGRVSWVQPKVKGASGKHLGIRSTEDFLAPEELGGGPFTISYAHCFHIFVVRRQFVWAGDIVALAGNTGDSTGPHAHVRLRTQKVKHFDPFGWFEEHR